MPDVQKLIDKILEDASTQAQANIEKAKEQAQTVLESARKLGEEQKAQFLQRTEENAVEMKKRMISAASMEGRKKRLEVRQKLISQALERATNELINMPQDKYVDFIVSMALNSQIKGHTEVILSKEDRQKYGEKICQSINVKALAKGIGAHAVLSSETRHISGGAILRNDQIEINNSIDAIFRLNYDQLVTVAADILF